MCIRTAGKHIYDRQFLQRHQQETYLENRPLETLCNLSLLWEPEPQIMVSPDATGWGRGHHKQWEAIVIAAVYIPPTANANLGNWWPGGKVLAPVIRGTLKQGTVLKYCSPPLAKSSLFNSTMNILILH